MLQFLVLIFQQGLVHVCTLVHSNTIWHCYGVSAILALSKNILSYASLSEFTHVSISIPSILSTGWSCFKSRVLAWWFYAVDRTPRILFRDGGRPVSSLTLRNILWEYYRV